MGSLHSYYINQLGFWEYRNGWLKGTCPICGREDKCGVNLEKNFVHCFVCGYAKPADKTVMSLEKISNKQELRSFLKFLPKARVKRKPVKTKPFKGTISLPEGFTLLSLAGREGELALRYLESRGFSRELAFKTRMGTSIIPGTPYYGYIIIPYYRKGKLFYYQGRTYKNLFPKFRNPSIEEVGVRKIHIIYNIDALRKYSEVFIVESIFNALTLGDNAIAMGGKQISKWQKDKLISSPVTLFNVILDPDAMKEARKLAMDLVLGGKEVRLITLPKGQDVNDLGKEATLRLLKSQDTIYNNINKIKLKEYAYTSNIFRGPRKYFGT